MQLLTKNETRTELTIKLISVDGLVKGLVLDESRQDGRLLYISEALTADEAWTDANEFVMAFNRSAGSVWN
jgi:hypothetical protein